MRRSRALPKPLIWRGTAKADFMAFPAAAQRDMGYALFLAQMGERHPTIAKTLRGFGGGAIVEVKERQEGDAYRAVYKVRFAGEVFVLHAFQKKSKKGMATPRADLELVRKRLNDLIAEMEKRT